MPRALPWLDWTLAKKNLKLREFTKRMIALRKQLFTFLFSKKSNYHWFNASGGPEVMNLMFEHYIMK